MSGEIVLSASALSVGEVVAQRELIKSTMKSAMEEGMHYGRVPGCGDKPTLMQPGAQLLGYLFKVRPEYEITERDFEGEHREYRILCKLFHQPTGNEVGQGVGICSTRESKYRYRNQAKEVTWLPDPVASSYWMLRNRAKESVKGKEDLDRWMHTVFSDREDISNIGTKKDDQGQWRFVEYHGGEGKVENPNIADVFNTVLKIAKKRSYVDAIITATASNDLFTQDLEDIQDNLKSVVEVMATPVKGTEPAKEPDKTATPAKVEELPKPAKQAEKAEIQDWRSVRVHFGTPGGPVKDRPLGELKEGTLKWLEEQMAKKTKPTKQDNLLIAALAMARGEKGSAPASACLEMLKAKCEAVEVSLAHIVLFNRHLGSKAESFPEIKEEEAKYILDNWKQAASWIEQEGDDIPL